LIKGQSHPRPLHSTLEYANGIAKCCQIKVAVYQKILQHSGKKLRGYGGRGSSKNGSKMSSAGQLTGS